MNPKCGFCQGTSFKLVAPTMGIQGATFKMQFVVCAKCNAAITVLSYYDPGVVAKHTEDKVDVALSQLSSLNSELHAINANIGAVMSAIRQLK